MGIDLSGWQKVMEHIAKEVYNGSLGTGELDDGHILKTYNTLNNAAADGYGGDWTKTDPNGMPTPEVLKMRQNIYRFSGAKDAAMLQQLNDKLTEGGKMKSWHAFKQDALKLNKAYNVNYLQAEWQTSKQAGYMAEQWKEFQDNAERFPNLEYRTQGDERVRPEHEVLNGIIKPLNDPFWDNYFPPNGWRCFEPGTPILTSNGWKSIEKIKRGDYLIGGSGNERFVGDVITNDFDGNLIVLSSERESVSCTPNHQFLTIDGWMTAEDIQVGNVIIQVDKSDFNRYILITNKDKKYYNGKVYNLSVWKDESYITPLGITHNCRCYTVQTAADHTPDEKTPKVSEKEVKPEFRKNVGKKGEIFKEGTKEDPIAHPYFRLAKETGYANAFELTKLNAPKYKVKTNGGSFKVNIFADRADLKKNIEASKTTMNAIDHQLNINAHVNVKNIKNPELTDENELLGDRVSPVWKGNVNNAVNNAFKDKLSSKKSGQLSTLDHTFIVLEANFKSTPGNIQSFTRQSWSKFKHYDTLNYVIYYRGNKAVKIDRNSIENGYQAYEEKVKTLFKGK